MSGNTNSHRLFSKDIEVQVCKSRMSVPRGQKTKDIYIDLVLDGLFIEYVSTKNVKKLKYSLWFIEHIRAEYVMNYLTDEVHIYYFKYLWLRCAEFIKKLDKLFKESDQYIVSEAELEYNHEEFMNDLEVLELYQPIAKRLESGQIKQLPKIDMKCPKLPDKLPNWNFKEELTKYLIEKDII